IYRFFSLRKSCVTSRAIESCASTTQTVQSSCVCVRCSGLIKMLRIFCKISITVCTASSVACVLIFISSSIGGIPGPSGEPSGERARISLLRLPIRRSQDHGGTENFHELLIRFLFGFHLIGVPEDQGITR